MLMESPITRQLNFPGVLANGGPVLQMRSAGITVEMFSAFTKVGKSKFTDAQTASNRKKFML